MITGPPKPDLVIKAFTAKVNGMDIDYEIKVCNEGTINVLFLRLDLYYKRTLAPSPRHTARQACVSSESSGS